MNTRKLIIALVAVFLFTFSFFIYGQVDSKLTGNWEGHSGKGEVIKIEFHKDGTTELYKGLGGLYKGKRTPAIFWPTYKIDDSIIPNRLDLFFSVMGGKKSSDLKCIVKFINNKEIEIGLPDQDNYPENFDVINVREIWKLRKSTKRKSKK